MIRERKVTGKALLVEEEELILSPEWLKEILIGQAEVFIL